MALVSSVSACSHAPPVQRASQEPPQQIRYALEPEVSDGAWSVSATIPPLASGAVVCAPAMGTRAGETLEWVEATADDEPVSVAWGRDGCFTAPPFAEGLRVRYRVRMAPAHRTAWRASSLSPYADGQRLVFPGETLFLEVGFDHPLHNVATVVEVESDSSALRSTLARVESAFSAPDNEVLLRSMWWLDRGVVEERGRTPRGSTLIVREPSLVGLSDTFVRDVNCVNDQLETWAPGREPGDGAVFVFEAHWDASARTGFARRGGVILQVGETSARDVLSTRRLLAHELFHRINGQGLTFDPKDGEATTWFHEGTTSYVAALSLVHSGLASPDDLIETLAAHASSYLANPARDSQDASELDWARLPYDRGVLLSLALDLFMRDISQGTRTMQGFWQYLARTPQWSQPQTTRQLRAAMSDYTGADLSAFFDRYVDGFEPLPVQALLRQAGLAVSTTETPVATYGMVVDYDVERMVLVVTAVTPEDTAAQAGVREGDVLMPLAGADFEATDRPIDLQVLRGDAELFVRLKPRLKSSPALALALDPSAPGPLVAIMRPSVVAESCPGPVTGP